MLEFCRVVREARPRSFCIENVPGLLNHAEFMGLELLRAQVNKGTSDAYELTFDILNAAAYGVPQLRRRVFIVGWRSSGEFTTTRRSVEPSMTLSWM